MNTAYIETYGCQMNEYDSEIVMTILADNGYEFTGSAEDASVVLLNTCSVRENAHQKVMRRISELKNLKLRGSLTVLGVIGCMAQNLKDELLVEGIGVDVIAGPDTYRKLPELIDRFRRTGRKAYELNLSRVETYSDVFPVHDNGTNAWVAIMRGCDNVCTFCVVPFTRGRERSRDPQGIVSEVERLANSGFKQVTLLGQNVNSYASDGKDFADLMEMVCAVEGIRRVRFTSPHPKDFPKKLVDVISSNQKACKHIHLPLQAGNDRVLEMMNRTYTKSQFIDLAKSLRRSISGLSLTTDIIVGFPTETEDEFQDTLEVMREVDFDAAFTFKYSERKNTVAQRKYPDDVPEVEKTSRITRLVDLQRKLSFKRNEAHLNQVFDVLVEGHGKKENQLLGRNDANKIVVFPNNGRRVGDFLDVRIDEVTPNTLIGNPV